MQTHSENIWNLLCGPLLGVACAMAAFAAPAQEPPAVAPPVPEAALLPPSPEDEQKEDLVEAMRQLKGIRIKSLLFDSNDISYIRYSQRVYLKDAQTADLEDFDEAEFLRKFTQKKSDDPQVTAFTYPQFFLNSIVYHTPTDWTIWITDSQSSAPRQITNESQAEGADLEVAEVGKEKAVLVWKPLVMEKVVEVWAQSKNEGVIVDQTAGTVTFTLQPNQTFTSFLMRVVDGRLQPVTIGSNAASQPSRPTLANPDVPGLPSNLPPEQEAGQGIGGLIREYEKMQSGDSVPPAPAGNAPPPPTPGNTMPGKAAPAKPSLPKPIALDKLPINPDTLK